MKISNCNLNTQIHTNNTNTETNKSMINLTKFLSGKNKQINQDKKLAITDN